MWNFKRRLFAILVLIITLSVSLFLWDSGSEKQEQSNDSPAKKSIYLLKRLVLDSEDKHPDAQSSEKAEVGSSFSADKKVDDLKLPPHTYIQKKRNEREQIGIDTEFLLAPPEDTLMYKPPKYLPDYRNPCFPVNYNEVLKYADKDLNLRKVLLDFDELERGRKNKDEDMMFVTCLPSFYLVGWPKCGTTEFTSLIQRHQSVYQGLS